MFAADVVSDDEIRNFVEKAKALANTDDYELLRVPAERILEFYSVDIRHGEGSEGCKKGTSLYSACFQFGSDNPQSKERFKFFLANPEKVNMCVALHKGKLDARCLAWKGEANGEEVWMGDRIYNGSPQGMVLLTNFCKEQGIIPWQSEEWYKANAAFKSEMVYDTTFQYYDYFQIVGYNNKKGDKVILKGR